MTYQEAEHYLYGLLKFGIKLGNERFEALLARLGSPHQSLRVAHVAGTKGKGSTTRMIAAILEAHGFRTGGYFSPYVYNLRERIQINGAMISEVDFAELITRVADAAAEVESGGLGQSTEFEVKTAVGLLHFAGQVDYAAIEVGIGGRLDASNVVFPSVTVITNIGLDHMHLLGETTALIAAEKAGILKRGIPCVTATTDHDAIAVIRETAEVLRVPLREVAVDSLKNAAVHVTNRPMEFDVVTDVGEYRDLVCGMRGDYQRVNAACAIGAVEELAKRHGWQVNAATVREALAHVQMPGRFEVVGHHPMVILDGAHNAMAIKALLAEVAKVPYRRLIVVAGMVLGHEPEDVIAPLARRADRFYATRPNWVRTHSPEAVAEVARRYCGEVIVESDGLTAARMAISEAGDDDLVLVTGSFYLVGEVGAKDKR